MSTCTSLLQLAKAYVTRKYHAFKQIIVFCDQDFYCSIVGIHLSCRIMESAMGLVMLCSHRWRKDWSDLSRALAWAKVYGGRALPTQHGPLSPSLTRTKGMQGNTFGISLAAGVAGRKPPLTSSRLRDSTPHLYSGFTSIAYSMNGYNRKAVEYRYLNKPIDGALNRYYHSGPE